MLIERHADAELRLRQLRRRLVEVVQRPGVVAVGAVRPERVGEVVHQAEGALRVLPGGIAGLLIDTRLQVVHADGSYSTRYFCSASDGSEVDWLSEVARF